MCEKKHVKPLFSKDPPPPETQLYASSESINNSHSGRVESWIVNEMFCQKCTRYKKSVPHLKIFLLLDLNVSEEMATALYFTGLPEDVC